MRTVPTDTHTLLDQLDKMYPPRCRKPGETEREHERYAGKVDLVQELIVKFDRSPSTTL